MEFSINISRANAMISQFEAEKNKLNNYRSSVQSVIANCPLSGSTKTAVIRALKTAEGNMEDESQSLLAMKTALGQIIADYLAVEEKLAGTAADLSGSASADGAQESGGTAVDGSSDEEETSDSLWNWSDLWSLIGKMGIGGGLIAAIGQLLTGGDAVTSVLKSLKSLASVVDSTAKNGLSWEMLFGLNAKITESTPTTFWGNLADQAEKLNFSNAETVTDKISVGAKYAGYLLTGAITTYDNFTDPENTTLWRKMAESVGETAFKIGEGILVSAAVTTAFAAIAAAAVGAPVIAAGAGTAIVIGGTTAVIMIGIDKAFEYFTGKDAAEWVSDTIIDGAVSAANYVGDKAQQVKDAVSGWWSSFTGSIAWG
ncbi:MAG: hypothetical protein LIO75_06375 [Lachnospiraceae bacterium]|nr:hypothetical protein [Lachnospiraceae bacterium]